MAINISLDMRQEVDRGSQPIPRSFTGYDGSQSDELLWDANRGVYDLDDQAQGEQFATFSHDGTIRLVAELEGIETIDHEGRPAHALLGRILPQGDPVRDALVGRQVDADEPVSYIDTSELESMTAAERYAPSRERRTFIVTFNPSMWVWTPEDEQRIIERTAAGAPHREPWSAGGRRQGIEPGDRIFLLQTGAGRSGIRASGVVSSQVYQGEHWDDPARKANYIDIDWDMMLPAERIVPAERLMTEISGYGWTPQKGGVELHQPMADQMEDLWQSHLGDTAPSVSPPQVGWQIDDPRRRVVDGEARRRLADHFLAEGWEVTDTHMTRPYDGVATRDGQTRYLVGKGVETASRPLLISAEAIEHLTSHPDECVVGVLSDVEFSASGAVEPESGIFDVRPATFDPDDLQPVLYQWPSEAGDIPQQEA